MCFELIKNTGDQDDHHRDFFDDNNSDWKFFFSYNIGKQIGQLVNYQPLVSNSYPNSCQPSFFYKHLLSLIRDNIAILSNHNISTFTVKFLYKLLFNPPATTSPGVERWSNIYPTISWKTLWNFVFDDFTENRKNELQWFILHRAVKTAQKLAEWKYLISPNCSVCGRPETITHLFLNCNRSKSVWAWAMNILSSLTKVSSDLRIIAFFLPFEKPKRRNILAWFVKSVNYAVWKFRNISHFDHIHKEAIDIINFIKSDIRQRIYMDLDRYGLDKCFDTWGLNSIFCTSDGKKLILNF